MIPYVNAQRDSDYREVTSHLLQNNIYFITVPNNMTHLFQPLDFTVNGNCQKFMKNELAKW